VVEQADDGGADSAAVEVDVVDTGAVAVGAVLQPARRTAATSTRGLTRHRPSEQGTATMQCLVVWGPVRHARTAALDELEPFLERLRSLPGLVEKTRGVFYRRSRAFLHFHEDPTGLHADVRVGDDFQRFRVETPEERDALLVLIGSHDRA
jgi:hypothetical protein